MTDPCTAMICLDKLRRAQATTIVFVSLFDLCFELMLWLRDALLSVISAGGIDMYSVIGKGF